MIETTAFTAKGIVAIEDSTEISDHVRLKGTVLWVDLTDPSAADFACVQEEFELHPLAMEDAAKHGQRPKLEHYPTHSFIVAYSQQLAEVDLFIGPNWIVTVRGANEEGETWNVAPARARYERTRGPKDGVGFLVYTLLDELVDGYFNATDIVEERLEGLEDAIFGDTTPDERGIQSSLFQIRRELLHFRRSVVPLREVVGALLRREVEWVDARSVLLLQDVYDHVLRAIDLIDTQRELMGNAVDAHLAILSNRMNEVMKSMTSWGALLLGSTLIAGIYGMNFEHMPELGWQYGYPFALLLMIVMTAVGYRYFKRRNWL